MQKSGISAEARQKVIRKVGEILPKAEYSQYIVLSDARQINEIIILPQH